MTKTITLHEFDKSFQKIHASNHDYRIGQHFINLFIKDSSSDEMCRLWNEKDQDKAGEMIVEIIQRYQWDFRKLPVLREDLL